MLLGDGLYQVRVYKAEEFVQSKTLLANDGRHLKEEAPFLSTNVSLHVIFVLCWAVLQDCK